MAKGGFLQLLSGTLMPGPEIDLLRQEVKALSKRVTELESTIEAQRTICRECGHQDHQIGHHYPGCTRRGCECPRFT